MDIKAEQQRILSLTNSELQREVAEYMGWSSLTYHKQRGLYGVSPENGKVAKIPPYVLRADEALKVVVRFCDDYPNVMPLFVYNPENRGWYVTFYIYEKADRVKLEHQAQEVSLLLGQAIVRIVLLLVYIFRNPDLIKDIGA